MASPRPPLGIPSFMPQPPSPPTFETGAFTTRPPDTWTHRQAGLSDYSVCWHRLLQKLNQDQANFTPFLYLLGRDNDLFNSYELLVAREEPVYVVPEDEPLRLRLTSELWDELRHYREKGDPGNLSRWLSQQQGLLSTNISPVNFPHVGTSIARSSSRESSPLKRHASNRSWKDSSSRRQSDAGTTNSESGEPGKECWWCPLIAHSYCSHAIFKKWGNLKNHIEQKHGWYVKSHPRWAEEVRLADDLQSWTQPGIQTCTRTDGDFDQVGTGFHLEPAAEAMGADIVFGQEAGPIPPVRPYRHPPLLPYSELLVSQGRSVYQQAQPATADVASSDAVMNDNFPDINPYETTRAGQHINFDRHSELRPALLFGEHPTVGPSSFHTQGRPSQWPQRQE